MKRVIEKINEVLENHKNIGYIGIYYENKLVGYFATEKDLRDDGIEMPNGMIFFENRCHMADTIKKILEAKRTVRRGDYYGDSFTGYLTEEIWFYKE